MTFEEGVVVRLSRSEAKEATRRKLMRAALAILDAEGEAGVTTVAVAKAAGIAQSSFYVHFKDTEELLRAIGSEGGDSLRATIRDARRQARENPDSEGYRDAFRIPLEAICRHPEILRMLLRARHDPSSPLRDLAIQTADVYRTHHAADLAALGYVPDSPEGRRRLEIIADAVNAATNALAIGHLEGRYPNLEEVVDVLVSLSKGALHPLRASSTP
ncbi:TetR family transcriptional regulator [Nonomuraea soli]|uniref:AcrR family transcriptional regulator n=1 Tax=Nonomuraea soli TaxID=1032476 RepID=A0A7W0CG87_9ACTN|nr:TetR family transcriptional regulator [Nonomuraea soli]MBA2890390.1 AcrR family transcriptional regulator [Nonomuraea soli]